jgi:hypothetical protein
MMPAWVMTQMLSPNGLSRSACSMAATARSGVVQVLGARDAVRRRIGQELLVLGIGGHLVVRLALPAQADPQVDEPWIARDLDAERWPMISAVCSARTSGLG